MKPEDILKKFVEGNLSISKFEKELYQNTQLEDFLSNENLITQSMNIDGFSNPYFYLIAQNYNDAETRLNIHNICEKILTVNNRKFKSTTQYENFYDLMLTTQPKYLDIDSAFFEKHIYKTEYRALSKAEQKKKVKQRFNTLFQFDDKAPKWIQNPQWIIENNKPFYFIGQHEIKNSNVFHDNGYIYLFLNKESGEIKTVVQLY